jgi:hypothetical protein
MLAAVLLLLPLSPAAFAADGWDLLKSLAGDWDAKSSEGQTTMSYQVISNGSAVMETMKRPDGASEMVTIYHRDGSALMATHYCSAGNQPRMRSESLAADGNRIVFRFQDVTNLSSPSATHIRGITMTVTDKNHVTQEWSARDNGKDSTMVFQLTRKTSSN